VLLKAIADREVAELGRVHVPGNGVAARPVTGRAGADVERHADPVAQVEPGSPHLGEVPAWAEVSGAPLPVGLKPPDASTTASAGTSKPPRGTSP
jgi:hypothetical protein